MNSKERYYKKNALLATLRKIEKAHLHEGFIVKNFWRLLALGVLLSLAIPAQGLGMFDFKGTSILELMEATYWEVALIIAVLYTIFCTIGHFGWKLQDYLYLKELNEKKERLIKELGILSVEYQTNQFTSGAVKDLNPNKNALKSAPSPLIIPDENQS